jgi:hypothetical protein
LSFFGGQTRRHDAGFDLMSESARLNKLALLTAEEILRTIYGDDLEGCQVSQKQIALIIEETMKQRERQTRELLHLYEKVVEAMHVLSTPPDSGKITTPAELQALLSGRLDTIHTVAKKTMDTIDGITPSTGG